VFYLHFSVKINSTEFYCDKKPWWDLLQAGFLLSLLFDPEGRGGIFLRNVGSLSPNYTALYAVRWNC
jgi:hypothetical protein